MARPRAQDYQDKQINILENAVKLFARLGFTGASMNMIAKACGMSKALLYHYYPDKNSLLFAILHQHLFEFGEAVKKSTFKGRNAAAKN